MNLSKNAQAVLLLTTYFSKPVKGAIKPLTFTEWGRFAQWLKEANRSPADLLNKPLEEVLDGWSYTKISRDRIETLLGRGHAMALAMDKWSRAGVWVLTRSDPLYPNRLKARLKNDAPPVLFGCGNVDLLGCGGIAVVGSRNAEARDLQFTEVLGRSAAYAGYSIVSGGARGVDEKSMLAAVQAKGTAVGILADGLIKGATSSKWRQGLMNNNLVLVSPFYPEAGFNVGNAMARNKYIYCLADTSVVVHAGRKGGTWNGALENLRKRWIPLWVKPTTDEEAGNAEIVVKGGRWCEESADVISLPSLFDANVHNEMSGDLFSSSDDAPLQIATNKKNEITYSTKRISSNTISLNFYQLFLNELYKISYTSPFTIEQVCEQLKLHKSQVRDWMERAVIEERVIKLVKPVRYQWNSNFSYENSNVSMVSE